MFEKILDIVKEHMGNNPEIANAIPPGQADAVHREIATHIDNTVNNQATSTPSGGGGFLSQIENSMASGGMVANAVEGGLASSLASKFGLSPMITGAIAASVPGLIQKYMHKSGH